MGEQSKPANKQAALTTSAANDMMSRSVKTLLTTGKVQDLIEKTAFSLIPRLPTESIKMVPFCHILLC